MPVWIAGIGLCALIILGIVVIDRSMPVSYAGIPDESGLPTHDAEASGAEGARAANAQANRAVALPHAMHRRYRARCPECGVVESMREIEHSGDGDGQGAIELDGAPRACGSALTVDPTAAHCFESTVRFSDGSRMVLEEASPRMWRAGSRLMVIGRANPSSD
jgi:hypothetical protein